MTEFCDISDVQNLLQVEISNATSCTRAITAATAAIQNYCRQEIGLVEDDEITLDVWQASYKIFLPEMPVVEIASVVEDDETLKGGSDEDYALAQYGVLLRRGRKWKTGPSILVVTYTHGYEDIPEDIEAICARAAARTYQAGLKSSADAAIPGVSGKSLGDFSVNYHAGTGGVGEGVMGVSGSRMLLLSEKDILDKYRYKGT